MKSSVAELIQHVREKLFEQQKTVIKDMMILRNLNEAYRLLYNLFAKDQPEYVGERIDLDLIPGRESYPIPSNIFNKRISKVTSRSKSGLRMEYPLTRINYEDRRVYMNSYMPSSSSCPLAYAVYGNHIYFFPDKTYSSSVSIFAVAEHIPLGLAIGYISRIDGRRLYVHSVDEAINDLDIYENFISVSDYNTGSLKSTYFVESFSGKELTLGSHPTRTAYKGRKVVNISTFNFSHASVSGGTVTLFGENSLSPGDKIEISPSFNLNEGYATNKYLALDGDLVTNISLNNDYSPPDFLVSVSPFPESVYTVTSATPSSIEIIDPGFKSLVRNGYVYSGDTVPPLGIRTTTPIGASIVEVVVTATGTLTSGAYYTLLFKDSTGELADLSINAQFDTTKFNVFSPLPELATREYDSIEYTDDLAAAQSVAITDILGNQTTITSLQCVGHGYGVAGDTIRITFLNTHDNTGASAYPYVEVTVVDANSLTTAKPVPTTHRNIQPTEHTPGFTGIPGLLEFTTSLDSVDLCDSYTGTPSLQERLLPTTGEGLEEIAAVDDWITLGVSTGRTVFGDNFEDFLVNMCTLKIRSSLNEFDEEVNKAIDQAIRDIRADIGTRDLGIRMVASTPRMTSSITGRRIIR